MTTKSAKSSLKPTSKEAWAKASDSGPHTAVLPSRKAVRFRILSPGELLAYGGLPEGLREAAELYASHPDGPDQLMRELVITASLRDSGQTALNRLIQAGRELEPHIVAAMLVEPQVTAEEVASGAFPELDVRMLLEFAERLRNVDAAGNRLPIITLDEWATFRAGPERDAGAADGRDAEGLATGALSDADGGSL